MLRLAAARSDQIDARTVRFRQLHHLTEGWVVSQNWLLIDEEARFTADAQVIVRGHHDDCAAVVRVEGKVEVVLCTGLVQALTRMGIPRDQIRVA